MLFLQGKDRKCLQKYVAGTHRCLSTFRRDLKQRKQGGYKNCVNFVTTNLEACSLMELIEADDFKRFHIDRTAWMSLRRIRNARSECGSLIKASTHTLRKVTKLDQRRRRMKGRKAFPATFSNMARTWQKYVRTFRKWQRSVNHEAKIIKLRSDINRDAAKNADKYDDIREQEVLKKKLSEKIQKFKDQLTVKKRKLGSGQDSWDDLKEKVERLTKKLKDLRKDLEDARKDGSKCGDEKKEAEDELATNESKLAELIASRERQPLGKLKRGLEIQYWNVRNVKKPTGGNTPKWYDNFDFENPQNAPDKYFIAPFLKMQNKGAFKIFWGKKLGKTFTQDQFLFKATGVFHAKKTDKYTFQLTSDDGSFLYFGAHAHKTSEAVIKNGNWHGMRVKKFQNFPMKKGQDQMYVITFWQHMGGAGIKFKITDSKRRQIHGAFKHFDTSMQRV